MMILRTIRARLLAGFSASIGLLLLAGAVGWYGLRDSNAEAEATVRALADRSEFTERASNTILRELVAGLRYLNTGSASSREQYLALVDQADGLRRDAIQKQMLLPDERRRLESIGGLQAAMEVRIATTRAWQVAGMTEFAQIALEQTTQDMQAIETELQGLRRAARGGAMASVEEMRIGAAPRGAAARRRRRHLPSASPHSSASRRRALSPAHWRSCARRWPQSVPAIFVCRWKAHMPRSSRRSTPTS